MDWKKEFRSEFQNDEMFSSRVPELWCDAIVVYIQGLLEERKKEILQMITNEINQCLVDGQPISRLTSLYNKISDLE